MLGVKITLGLLVVVFKGFLYSLIRTQPTWAFLGFLATIISVLVTFIVLVKKSHDSVQG